MQVLKQLRTAVVRSLACTSLTVFAAFVAGLSLPALAATELVFAGFGGSFQKAMEKTVIPMFEKKYDAKVIYVTGTSNQLLAKVRAQRERPQIDVIWANDTTHYQGKKEGVFEKLDPKIVTNLQHLYPVARDADDVGVVMGIQAIALEYNTKVFKENGWAPPTSWNDLWDPKYAGHVVLYNMPIGYTNLLLGVIAEINGGSASNLEPAWAKIAKLAPNALASVNPPAQVDTLFSLGSAWIAFNGSARIHDLARTGVPVAMAIPKEGAIVYPQQFDVVKGAPHAKLAQEFVNFALSPEAQQQIAKTMLLGPVNKDVKLQPDAAANVPYGEKEVQALVHVNSDPINSNLQQLTQRWSSIIGGGR